MAFCYSDCEQQVSPGIVSIGNRVWNDYNKNGINDPDEPGIPGVSLVLWGDSDGDDVPDWEGFQGVEVTDEEGYYTFTGLDPGNYVVFVWSVDNLGAGSTPARISNLQLDMFLIRRMMWIWTITASEIHLPTSSLASSPYP